MGTFDASAYMKKRYSAERNKSKKEENVFSEHLTPIFAKDNPVSSSKTSSSTTSDSFDASAYMKKKYAQNGAISEFGLDTLGDDLTSLSKTINGWQTRETMDNTLSSVQSMYDRLGKYQEYQKKYGGTDLSEVLTSYKSVLDGWEDLSKYYGQYKDAESYTKETTRLGELGAMSSSDVEKAMNDATSEIDKLGLDEKLKTAKEYEQNIKKISNSAMNIRNPSAVKPFQEALKKATNERDNYLKSIGYESTEALEKALSGKTVAYTTVGGENITWNSLYDTKKYNEDRDALYKEISSMDDFEKYKTKGASDKDNVVEYAIKNRDALEANTDSHSDFARLYDTEVTSEERDIYNYYLGKEREGLLEKGTADAYRESILGRLQDRFEGTIVGNLTDFANRDGVGASAFSVMQSLGSGVEWLADSATYLRTGELDDNFNARSSSAIRSTVSQNVDWEIGNWDAFDFVYNTGMSMADSVTSMALFGGAGGVALGLSAAAQGTNDALARGLDNKRAFWSGLSAGVFEGLFESVSIGKFKALKDAPVDSVKAIIKNVGKSMLVNASEETLTEIANLAYDYIANGDLSQAKTSIRAYVNSGMSEEEAIRKVAIEQGLQVVEAGASGALMGMGFGGFGGTVAYNTSKQTGQNIKANERVQEVFDIASNPEVASAYDTYTRYANKGINADNITDSQLGRLYSEAYQESAKVRDSKKSTAEQVESAKKTIADLDVYGQYNPSAKISKKIAKDAVKDEESVKALIESGLESGENTESFKLATEYQAKLDSGKKLSTNEIAKLVDANERAYKAEDSKSVTERLTELGESTELADIVTRKLRGETLTTEEAEKVLDSDVAQMVIAEEGNAENVTDELISKAKTMDKENGALFIALYDGRMNVDEYANAFNLVTAKAENNFTFENIIQHKKVLSGEQISKIYSEVRIKADHKQTMEFQKLVEKTANLKAYKAVIDESAIDYSNTSAEGKVNWNDLTARQRKAVTFIKGLAQATGMNVTFVANESYNGKYDMSENTIYINLDKNGMDAITHIRESVIPTMSHELTHWMEKKSPELYRRMNAIVFSTLQKHDGLTEEERIAYEITNAVAKEYKKQYEKENPGKSISLEKALEMVPKDVLDKARVDSKRIEVARSEIIARACEDMLSKSEQGMKMFNSLSASEQKTLGEKIKELILLLKDWVSDLLGLYKAGSYEAKVMRAYEEDLNELLKVWDAMLEDSVKVDQALEKSGAFRENASAESNVLFCERSNLPSEFNPDGLTLREQLAQAFDESESKERRYVYVGEFTQNFVDKLKKHITIKKLPIVMNYRDAYLSMKSKENGKYQGQGVNYHNLGLDGLESALKSFDNPEYVLLSETEGKIELILEGRDYKNRQLFSIVEVNTNAQHSKEYLPAHVVNSVYGNRGLKNRIANAETEGRIIYNKKEESSQGMPQVQYERDINDNSSKDSILYADKIVKENISDIASGYAKAQEMQTEINQLTNKIRELEKGDDFKAVMDVFSEAIKNNDTEKGIAEYEKWLKESGYSEARERRDTLQNELDKLKKDLQTSSKQKALDEEQEAIKKSGLSEADYFRKQAVKEFGYTPYFYDAGYITPNGKMLNFSGEKGQHYGSRGQDHRAIGIVYANVEGSKAMIKFMGEGNVRIMAESPGIDISSSVEPSTEQYATIRKFVREYANKEYFNVDLTDAEGYTVGNYEYEGKISAERVVNDIKYFFENGTTREQSSVSRFLYSDKDTEYLELAKDPVKNETRLREMVYEAAKEAGYTDDSSWRMEHSAPNSRDDVSLDKLKESGLIPDDFWEHPEWYTYSAEERESYYKVKKAIETQEKRTSEGNPRDAYMWVYRAVDKTVNTKEDYFRNGDWVTPSKDYAINEGKMNPNGYRIIKHSVSIKHLYWDGNSIAELGYDDGNTYAYADTLNNRKLLDPVTYDDFGLVIPLSKRFKRRNWDVRYSEKDSAYMDAVESGDVETASRLIEEAAEKAFSNSKVRGSDGKLRLVYHGTVNDFTVFKRQFANIEGDFGKGYYFTSNEYDVDANYANEEGPDLKNKIARLAERLEWEDEYSDLSYEEREEIARQRLITSEPNTITAYLNMENPVYITPDEQGTLLDYNESYDEEYDEFGEPEGLLIDFIEALQNNASDYAFGDVDFSFLYEYACDNGGVYASDAVKIIKNRIIDELTDENGDVAINEVIRLAFEEIGFDGIIDTSVYYKFRNMDGMDSGTTHYIVFDSEQIKSADIATYDDNGNVIPLSQRFNLEDEDIRYSEKDYSYESLVAKPDMKLTVLDSNVPSNRADIIYHAKRNAAKVGNLDTKNRTVSVYVDDIGKDVVIGTKGLEHGLRRAKTLQTDANSFATLKAGEIIKNSIRINELTPKNQNADASYALIGAAKNTNGDLYIVESVINQFSNELMSMDVLYSINTKKESAMHNASRYAKNSLSVTDSTNRMRSMRPEILPSVTDSTISIAELLDYVNEYFPDILPESILRHYGYDARPDGKLGEDALYSEKETTSVYDLMGEKDRLRKENEMLKKDLDRLKERLSLEKKVTGGNYFEEKSLDAVAVHLRKIANSTYSKNTLLDELKDFYTYVRDNKWSGENLFGKAYELAEKILADAKPLVERNDYAKGILNEIRGKRISLTETQKQEARNVFGDKYLNAFFGKIIIANDGISLDSQWQEWASEYPGLFKADTNEGDQITALYDVYNDLRDASEVIYEYDMEEQARWLANEILNKYWTISRVKTTADKYDMQINVLNFEHRKAMAEFRSEYEDRVEKQRLVDDMYYRRKMSEQKGKFNAELAAQRKAEQERHQKLVREIRERKDNQIAIAKQHGRDMMDKYKDNAERKTILQSTMATVMSLNKKLTTNSKDVHIPESLKPVVINLINAIDFSSKQLLGMSGTKKDFRGMPTKTDIAIENTLSKVRSLASDEPSLKIAIQDALELFENAEKVLSTSSDGTVDSSVVALDVGMIDGIKKMIRDLNIITKNGETNFVLQEMSTEHLKTLNGMVKSINHWAIVADQALANKHKKRISDLGMQTINELDELGNRQEYVEGIELVKHFFNWSNALPINAFKRLGNAAMEFFDGLRDSQDTAAFNKQEIMDFTDDLFKKYKDAKSWRTDIKTFKVSLPGTEDVTTVSMPVSYIMSLYCVSKQEDAKRHLYGKDDSGNNLTYKDEKGNIHNGGGMTIKGFKEGKLKLKVNKSLNNTIINEDIVRQITNVLTKEQREVADALQGYMNTKGSEWGDAVSMALYGIKKFGVKDYFPITVSPHTLNTDKVRDKIASLFSILNYGFTKERNPHASQSIEIGDIFEIFANHMNMVAIYNAYALSVYDIARWYNFKGRTDKGVEIAVTKSIETAFGSGATTYVSNLIKDLNGQHESSRLGIIAKMFKNAKAAMVGNSLSVTLLQPTAYLKAMVKIPPKYLFKSFLYVKDFGARKGVEKAKKYCGIALLKSQGYFETGVSANTTTKMLHDESFREKSVERSLKGAEWMDERTWGMLWNACEFETRATRKDLKVGSKEFYDVIANKLRDVIYETQVVDSPLTKSDLMRSSDTGAKMVTMFASELTVAYNMVFEAAYKTHLDANRYQEGKGFQAKAEALTKSLKKNRKNLAMTLTAYTLTSVANALIRTAVDSFRYGGDDDEEENQLWENFKEDWNFIGKIPYAKDLLGFSQGFSSSKTDTLWLESAYKAYEYWCKVAEGKEDKTIKAVDETLKSLSYARGYGFYNQWRELKALLNAIGIID